VCCFQSFLVNFVLRDLILDAISYPASAVPFRWLVDVDDNTSAVSLPVFSLITNCDKINLTQIAITS